MLKKVPFERYPNVVGIIRLIKSIRHSTLHVDPEVYFGCVGYSMVSLSLFNEPYRVSDVIICRVSL
jgi:hypothetical protein